jgi:hypothetical protein
MYVQSRPALVETGLKPLLAAYTYPEIEIIKMNDCDSFGISYMAGQHDKLIHFTF